MFGSWWVIFKWLWNWWFSNISTFAVEHGLGVPSQFVDGMEVSLKTWSMTGQTCRFANEDAHDGFLTTKRTFWMAKKMRWDKSWDWHQQIGVGLYGTYQWNPNSQNGDKSCSDGCLIATCWIIWWRLLNCQIMSTMYPGTIVQIWFDYYLLYIFDWYTDVRTWWIHPTYGWGRNPIPVEKKDR